MKQINKIIAVAPFVMIGVSAVSAVFSYFVFYPDLFKYLPDLVGYSILSNLVFIKVYFRRHFCHPTKLAVLGLILMNVVNLLTIETEYHSSLYDIFICFTVIVLIIGFKLKK